LSNIHRDEFLCRSGSYQKNTNPQLLSLAFLEAMARFFEKHYHKKNTDFSFLDDFCFFYGSVLHQKSYIALRNDKDSKIRAHYFDQQCCPMKFVSGQHLPTFAMGSRNFPLEAGHFTVSHINPRKREIKCPDIVSLKCSAILCAHDINTGLLPVQLSAPDFPRKSRCFSEPIQEFV
jgi:hypothetical protein